MAVATDRLTYEQYLAEPEIRKRYDIIDGVRRFMTNPTIGHQKTQGRIYIRFVAWQEINQSVEVVQAPCDVLIQRSPLRTRQPDVLVISRARLGDRDLDDPAPLDPAPELVVEIVSPSDTGRPLQDKLADFAKVGVLECWVVHRRSRTIDVRRLTAQGDESVAVYGVDETVQSLTFPDLRLAVADVLPP
jgi:Uma2 family endonuclease